MPRIPVRPAATRTAGVVAACITLAAAGAASGSISTLQPGSLTVCTFSGFPPTSYAGPGGAWAGLDARFLRRFAASAGLAVDARIARSFDGIWRRPGAGECDVAAAGISVTDERRQDMPGATFTSGYHTTLRAFVVRKGSTLTGVRGLAGKTILVGKGTIAQQDVQRRVRRAGVKGVRVRFGSGEVASRRAVRAGRAFAYETDDLSAEQAARLDPRLAVAWVHPRLDARGRNAREVLAYVVRDASTGLLPALNAFIAAERATYAG